MFYYIYVLKSFKDNNLYTGYTSDLKKRIVEHNKGVVFFTKIRGPFKLIYFEGCVNKKDAQTREKYLKTGKGRDI